MCRVHRCLSAVKISLPAAESCKGTVWHRRRHPLLLALLLCLPVNAWSQSSTDEALYTRACAACHGDDGAGRSVEDVGFNTPLPDFTDCEFASREPDPDWYAVIHQGGPVRAFDRMMPAFGAVLESGEIDAILRHVRTFCTDNAWPRGEFNLPRPLFTEKAFPEDEIVVTTTVGAGSPGAIESEFLYEKRFGPNGMVEIALPAGWRGAADPGASALADADSTFGLADLAIGWKQTVYHDLQRGSIFSVGGEVVLAADGPGGLTDRRVIAEPYVAYGHLLPNDAFIQVQALAEIMGDRSRADEMAMRVALGKTWTKGEFGRAWTPMIELLASRDLADSAVTHLDLAPQVQVALNTRQHILLNVGIRVPAVARTDRSTEVVAYLLWDWFDGGFLDGW